MLRIIEQNLPRRPSPRSHADDGLEDAVNDIIDDSAPDGLRTTNPKVILGAIQSLAPGETITVQSVASRSPQKEWRYRRGKR